MAIALVLNGAKCPTGQQLRNWQEWRAADLEKDVWEWEANVAFELVQAHEERERERIEAAAKRVVEFVAAAQEAERFQRERWMDAAAAAGACGW